MAAQSEGMLVGGPRVGGSGAVDVDVQLQAVLEALPQMAAMVRDGVLVQANSRWWQFFGHGPFQAASQHWLARVNPEDRPAVLVAWESFITHGHAPACECRLHDVDGKESWFEVRLGSPGDEVPLRAMTITDVSARRHLRQSLERNIRQQDHMLDASLDCIKLLNVDGTLRHMNRSGCLALGVPVEERAFGMTWLSLLPPDVRERGRRALAQAGSGRSARFGGKSVLSGHKPKYWDNILTPMFDGEGNLNGILCVSRDVTRQQEAEQRLRTASEVDELTGLPNRRSFNRRLRASIQRQRDRGGTLGLMIIDLDHFKHVNDTLGHPAGDHLLRMLSKWLTGLVPGGAQVARLGGDEFAIVMEDVDADTLMAAAEKVGLLSDYPVNFAGQVFNTGMSVGCALYPRDGQDQSELLKAADTALNDLKANGRGGVRMFSRRLMAFAEMAASQRLIARQLVRDAAALPYYQPKVDLRDGTVVGYEALLRWQRPGGGGVQADCHLDEAFRDYELASRLAELMHLQVLADIAAWQTQGLQVVPVAINAAPVEFLRDDFAENLLEKLQRFGVSPTLVELEVTEQVLSDRGSAFVARALGVLKGAGMRIALDDFGTGHSSLAHLRDYPIDTLKIDRSFVARMVEEPAISAIVEAIGKLGPSLRLELVAEGVESLCQRQILLRAGYRIGQGFLYDRAIQASEVAERLANGTRLLPA